MLTRVDVQSENPFYLQIRDARPTDSIIVEKIEGLDPPNIDLFIGDFARDGGYISGRRVPPRNVVLTLRLNPNYKLNESVSGLRTLLYKAFMDPFDGADSLTLRLRDDELPDRYVSGNVDKLESDIFDGDPVTTISMMCPNPYILDWNLSEFVGVGPQITFDYTGSAEVGFLAELEISGTTSYLTLDLNGRKMYLVYDFLSGDVVKVNTERGQRSITVTRSAVTTNILYALSSTSTWLEIHRPTNLLKAYGLTDASLIADYSSLKFRTAHWGV